MKQVTAKLSAGWELDFWGRLHNLRAAARNQYLATEAAQRAVATDLIAQIANGYLLEREYAERIGLTPQTIITREQSLRIMRRRDEVGPGSKFEVTQAETLLSQANVALEALVQDRGVNRNTLTLLVGRPTTIAAPLRWKRSRRPSNFPPGCRSNHSLTVPTSLRLNINCSRQRQISPLEIVPIFRTN